MFERIHVIGAGRVGSAVSTRLVERGIEVTPHDPGLVLLCVPDRIIPEVAAAVEPGPWLAHVSGATPLAALAPHERRFCVHPLQTIVHGRGPEQLDGAFAAITAETDEALGLGQELAELLGMRPFELADADKPLYHAAAGFACGYLVTLYGIAARLFELAGAPPAGLIPLMARTIDNGFELTGPISRGDWSTVDIHVAALRERAPDLEPLYLALAEATRA
jgi:predicted short-subunit dehydrogenase-like oxidoreductase (DUF2520 family)